MLPETTCGERSSQYVIKYWISKACEGPELALNVSAGTALFRQLSGSMRKTYARCEFFSP